jgi:hypothetical protein
MLVILGLNKKLFYFFIFLKWKKNFWDYSQRLFYFSTYINCLVVNGFKHGELGRAFKWRLFFFQIFKRFLAKNFNLFFYLFIKTFQILLEFKSYTKGGRNYIVPIYVISARRSVQLTVRLFLKSVKQKNQVAPFFFFFVRESLMTIIFQQGKF